MIFDPKSVALPNLPPRCTHGTVSSDPARPRSPRRCRTRCPYRMLVGFTYLSARAFRWSLSRVAFAHLQRHVVRQSGQGPCPARRHGRRADRVQHRALHPRAGTVPLSKYHFSMHVSRSPRTARSARARRPVYSLGRGGGMSPFAHGAATTDRHMPIARARVSVRLKRCVHLAIKKRNAITQLWPTRCHPTPLRPGMGISRRGGATRSDDRRAMVIR